MSGFRLLIVNFHYIREQIPPDGIYPVTPTEFEKQLDTLSRLFTFCSQEDVIKGLQNGFAEKNLCLITFDDGLAEQRVALEILQAKGIPAIFYVPVAPYLMNTTLTVHKLHYIRSVLSEMEFYEMIKCESPIESTFINPESVRVQYKYDTELAGAIKYYLNFMLDQDESTILVNRIFSQLVGDEAGFTKNLYMPTAEIKKLGKLGMLGSHGTNHRPLSTLPPLEIHNDIHHSVSFLEELTKTKIYSFSYPYGSKAAVNRLVADQFTGTEIKFALTMIRGINSDVDLNTRFFLKRVDTNDAPGGKNPLQEIQ